MDFVAGLKVNLLLPFFFLNVHTAFKVSIFNDFRNIICLMSLQQVVLLRLSLEEKVQISDIIDLHRD